MRKRIRRLRFWWWKRRLPGVEAAAAPGFREGDVAMLSRTGEWVRIDKLVEPLP